MAGRTSHIPASDCVHCIWSGEREGRGKRVHCGNAAVVISDFLSHSLTPFMTWPASRCQSQRLVLLAGSIGNDPLILSNLKPGNIVQVVNNKKELPSYDEDEPERHWECEPTMTRVRRPSHRMRPPSSISLSLSSAVL